jgi:hypothetical protein
MQHPTVCLMEKGRLLWRQNDATQAETIHVTDRFSRVKTGRASPRERASNACH